MLDQGAHVDIVDAIGQSPLDAALGRLSRGGEPSEAVAALIESAGDAG
jgi:hypothetical protein